MPPKITFQIYIEQEIGKKQARNNQTLLGCFEVWIDASESEFILIGPFKFNKTAAIKSVLRAVETPYPKVNPGEEEFQIDLTKMNAQDSTSGHQWQTTRTEIQIDSDLCWQSGNLSSFLGSVFITNF